MGDLSASDCSWKKMVLAKTNNKWMSKKKPESNSLENDTSEEYIPHRLIKEEIEEDTVEVSYTDTESDEIDAPVASRDPLKIEVPVRFLEKGHFEANLNIQTEVPLKRGQRKKSGPKNETPDERAARLAKMSAYAAKRLANESPEQRASRLKRMSEYAAKRLSQESAEQRARRLARMSAYAAQRLANETPQQRSARLSRMSAYAARRQAMRKSDNGDSRNESDLNMMAFLPNQS